MDFDKYQSKASETAIYPKEVGLTYTALGLANEGGEVAGKVKKLLRGDYGDNLDGDLTPEFISDVSKEIGDTLWYLAMLCTELGVSLSDIATDNLDKLLSRKQRNVIKGKGDNR